MKKWFRRLLTTATALASWLSAAALWAQDKQDAAAASGDKAGWAFSYLLVVLLVALGLMAVCRPGNRSKEIKREVAEE